MSWSESVLPWLSSHAVSLIIVLILVILADILYSRAYHRQMNVVGFARRLAQLSRPRPQPPQSKNQ